MNTSTNEIWNSNLANDVIDETGVISFQMSLRGLLRVLYKNIVFKVKWNVC